ncbi:hypothetical protein NFF91_17680, partial [Proteus mirabilis]
EWVHVQLHQQKGMISLSPPTICNSAVHTAPGERMDSEEPPNVRVACSGDIDEVVRLMHDAAAWMSAKGTPAWDVARIDRTFAETFVLRSELLGIASENGK